MITSCVLAQEESWFPAISVWSDYKRQCQSWPCEEPAQFWQGLVVPLLCNSDWAMLFLSYLSSTMVSRHCLTLWALVGSGWVPKELLRFLGSLSGWNTRPEMNPDGHANAELASLPRAGVLKDWVQIHMCLCRYQYRSVRAKSGCEN